MSQNGGKDNLVWWMIIIKVKSVVAVVFSAPSSKMVVNISLGYHDDIYSDQGLISKYLNDYHQNQNVG